MVGQQARDSSSLTGSATPVSEGSSRLRRTAESMAVLLGSLAILLGWYGAIGHRFGLTGDEPHYILIAHSLAVDGDLDLANNYAEGDADAWFPDLDADLHVNDYRGDGRLISVHTPGLPLLLLPAHALLNNPRRAARGTMLLLSALVLLEFYLLCREMSRSRPLSLAAWLVLATSVPMLYLSSQVYPDVAAALAVLLALRALRRLPSMRWTALLVLTICYLPFLHVRYIPLAPILGLAALWQLARRPRSAALTLFLVLSLLGTVSFVLFYVNSYGSPLGNAQYTYLSDKAVEWLQVPALAAGLLWDREVGILPVAPWLLVFLIGCASALVERGRTSLLSAALAVGYGVLLALALAAGLADWGWSLPWRFMLPVYPVMALVAFHAICRYRLARWLSVPLVCAGLLITAVSVRWPAGFYWRDAGVLAMPALDRGQAYLPSAEYAILREVPATAGVTTTHERFPMEEIPGPVCAVAGRDEPGFLSWGIRKGMLPGEMRVTLLVRGEMGPAGLSPGQVRVVDERTDQALEAHDITPEDLGGEGWSALSFTVRSDKARVLMAPVTYSGQGTLCLQKVIYEQTALDQRDCGYLLAGGATFALAAVGLGLGLASRRRARVSRQSSP